MIFAKYFVGFDDGIKVIKYTLITRNMIVYCEQTKRVIKERYKEFLLPYVGYVFKKYRFYIL